MSDSGQTTKYPSQEQMMEWVHQPYGRAAYSEVIRKACDWQREQDALIVDKRADANWSIAATHTLREAASAIRSGGSHD